MSLFLENILLGFFLAIVLGPVTVEIINRGLKEGFKSSALAVMGTMTAELIYFCLVFFGIYKFAQGIIFQTILAVLGILFILFLAAWNIVEFIYYEKSKKELKRVNPFISAFNITFFYPVNVFLWAGIIALSVSKDPSFLTSSGIIIGLILAYSLVCLSASLGKRLVGDKGARWVSLVSGLFLVYYGIKMTLDIFIL